MPSAGFVSKYLYDLPDKYNLPNWTLSISRQRGFSHYIDMILWFHIPEINTYLQLVTSTYKHYKFKGSRIVWNKLHITVKALVYQSKSFTYQGLLCLNGTFWIILFRKMFHFISPITLLLIYCYFTINFITVMDELGIQLASWVAGTFSCTL